MKPIYRQVNCVEGNRPDYRQARAVLRYNPDIIIFEMPEKNGVSDSLFNRYIPSKKPQRKILAVQDSLRIAAKKFKYALSDICTWENIAALWKKGNDIKLYNVDAPQELRSEAFAEKEYIYPSALKHWEWWVPIYLRERIMANHLKTILENYRSKERPVILIFLQSFHWQHVRFLLTNPSRAEIWKYYFGRFPKIRRDTIKLKIKKLNRVYYKYWQRYSDFN